jgi:hypothetical protein
MPERLDRITIALNRGDVIISWDTRQELMARLQHVRSNSGLRVGFGAVGASRPVELSVGQRAALLKVLAEWRPNEDDGIPAGLLELRHALTDEMAGGE